MSDMPAAQTEAAKQPSVTTGEKPYSVSKDERDGNDAICFTPGFPGMTFGAGTIHAYLAADREPPKVVAGISLGTVSAAVMQRSYSDLEKAKETRAADPALPVETIEAARWKFFRKYLATITNEPFSVIWNGIPDPTDFFAELPPIKDPVPGTITDSKLRAQWKKDELTARRELYLLVKLGQWMSRLHIRASTIANTLVSYVRSKEKYPSMKIFRLMEYLLWGTYMAVSLVLHTLLSPTWFPEYKFEEWREDPDYPRSLYQVRNVIGWLWQRPLFGRWAYAICLLIFLVLMGFTANLAATSLRYLQSAPVFIIVLSALSSIVCLFFTASLATLWVPMRGKFPFRTIPMLCSSVAVTLIALELHAPWFSDWLAKWSSHWKLNALDLLDKRWSYLGNLCWPKYLLSHPWYWHGSLLFILFAALILFKTDEWRNWLIKNILRKVAMEKHLVHDYHLKYSLVTLFGENADSPLLTNDPFPMVLVATPLQMVGNNQIENNQLWANPTSGAKLVDVLRATLAVPALLDPFTVKKTATEDTVKIWFRGPESKLDLVDGSIVRHNPLPAFFNFIRRNHADKVSASKESESIAASLESKGVREARVHVVYSVPAQASQDDDRQKADNIVDVAFLSLRLAQRRDINLEIDQTNFIARLARVTTDLIQDLPAGERDALQAPATRIFPVFADHIAPATDLSFKNTIAPEKDEVLRHAAAGCKATLQQLYAEQIRNNGGKVECGRFLTALRALKISRFTGQTALPEVCRHCDKWLEASRDSGKKAVFDDQEIQNWRERRDLDVEFPQLTSEEPRIVFVASGGVFRGPFHAGLINAMLALNIKPDLVVGASVGTLVGAALAATLAAKDRDASLQVLCELVETFQHVDERIAFTKVLKNAARELGLRGRLVELSPLELRKKILEGVEADPGFAATGTPPILIDAISDLLLIPHRDTSVIAAEFIAGHFTEALRLLVKKLKEETLGHLNIVNAVMGSSLIEPAARRLLGAMLTYSDSHNLERPWYDLASRQPYQKGQIAIFGTATDLIHQQPVLLGRYKFELPSYDFVNACLASSAFPAVFAPRSDEQIFPGLGDPDKVFSDGGMFDNLPLAPALEILTASQRNWLLKHKKDSVAALGQRVDNPDLFITGSLDISPLACEKEFDNVSAIKKRSNTLQNNVKIQAFEQVSEKIGDHFQFLYQILRVHPKGAAAADSSYLNALVNAVLLPVYPSDPQHLNGTFQFCNSLGRDPKVVNESMADGCFQTMRELAIGFGPNARPARAKVLKNLANRQRIPEVGVLPKAPMWNKPDDQRGYYCAFFTRRGPQGALVPFKCPFSEKGNSVEVFRSCAKDRAHDQKFHQIR